MTLPWLVWARPSLLVTARGVNFCLFSLAEVENKVDIPDICVELHGEVISLREGMIMAHDIDSRLFFKDDVIEEEEEGEENDKSALGSAQIVITAATPMVEEPEQPFPPPPVSIVVYNI